MNACIITIGNEIVEGSRLDTNSKWIAEKISRYKINVDKIVSIGDNIQKIHDEVKLSIDSYQYIFITGGLGPTHDDITLEAFRKVFNLKDELDRMYLEELKLAFQDRGMVMPSLNNSQAMILKNTEVLKNELGTARGVYYKYSNSNFFIMPGVPSEMYQMFEREIIPKYFNFQLSNNYKIICTSGIAESRLSERLENLMNIYSDSYRISFLPSYKGVDVILKSCSERSDEKIDRVATEFYNQMQPYSFGFGEKTFPQFMIAQLCKYNLSISVAESCTGGMIGKILTDCSGSSEVFLGGIISYSNTIKVKHLGVLENTIKKYGAVSSQVCEEMALNVKEKFNSSLGISTTGISGPGGESGDKKVGLVYIGVAYRKKLVAKKFQFNFNRDMNRKFTCYAVLNMIRKVINE